jgi:hypothetical protein
MPDITMCKGKNCPLKESCYRFTAKPDEWQSFFLEEPVKDRECDHFMEVWER